MIEAAKKVISCYNRGAFGKAAILQRQEALIRVVIFGSQHASLTIDSSDDLKVAIDASAKTRNRIDHF